MYFSIEIAHAIACFSVVVIHFGFLDPIGADIHAIMLYAVPFFFMVSGFFLYNNTAYEEQLKRIEKSIKKYGILYIKTAIVCVLVSIVDWYFKYNSLSGLVDYIKRTSLFDLLFDNTWPFELGGPIWYIAALVYAYALLWLLCRFKMEWLCLPIAISCLILNSVFTEFYGIWGWRCSIYREFSHKRNTFLVPWSLV